MYAFTLGTAIDATPARVWRALCDPAEVVQWDTGIEQALDAPADYPQPGQHVRWRYTNGPFRMLHDRPQEVEPERLLRALLSVGPFRFDETYTLEARDGRCHLTAAMEVRVPVPVIGWAVERLYLGPQTRRTVAASLQALKRHCENQP
ncbi:MAG: SRPBCC family protein [Chloroflexi bacterium]|nr:SRPBCC family protein [Chloroflexota bacterium]